MVKVKSTHHLPLILIIGLSIASIGLVINRKSEDFKALEAQKAEHEGSFTTLPLNSQVLLPEALSSNVNTVITYLDSNLYCEGRDAGQAVNPLLAASIIKEAGLQGGSGRGSTFFDDQYFDDNISVSVTTAYDKSTLKLLKSWEMPSAAGYTESMRVYSARIEVMYTVVVGGESYEGTYYCQSQINSPFDLEMN